MRRGRERDSVVGTWCRALTRSVAVAAFLAAALLFSVGTANADGGTAGPFSSEKDCLTVNGEYQRYYETTGCYRKGYYDWWFNYW
jgi:hypothetical protein